MNDLKGWLGTGTIRRQILDHRHKISLVLCQLRLNTNKLLDLTTDLVEWLEGLAEWVTERFDFEVDGAQIRRFA